MRRRLPQILVAVGVALVAITLVLAAGRIHTNSTQIAERPTKGQLIEALAKVRSDQRRACRVVNRRFAALATLVANQRPSAATTDYYRTHPAELVRAQRYFDDLLRVLAPRNCLRQYPPPSERDLRQKKRRRQARAAAAPPAIAATTTPRARPPRPRPRVPTTAPTPARPPPGGAGPAPAPPTSTTPAAPAPITITPPDPANPPPRALDVLCDRAPSLPICGPGTRLP